MYGKDTLRVGKSEERRFELGKNIESACVQADIGLDIDWLLILVREDASSICKTLFLKVNLTTAKDSATADYKCLTCHCYFIINDSL